MWSSLSSCCAGLWELAHSDMEGCHSNSTQLHQQQHLARAHCSMCTWRLDGGSVQLAELHRAHQASNTSSQKQLCVLCSSCVCCNCHWLCVQLSMTYQLLVAAVTPSAAYSRFRCYRCHCAAKGSALQQENCSVPLSNAAVTRLRMSAST